jgi:hypothetical protein
LRSPGEVRFDAQLQQSSIEYERGVGERMARSRAVPKASCENCFFGRNRLCAVGSSGPCATFRPDGPEGLRPPGQLRFVFGAERRLQVAWAFPSPAEQASLHA